MIWGLCKTVWGEENVPENALSRKFLDPSKRASGLLCRGFLYRKRRALTPEGSAKRPKPLFGRGVIREVFHPPLSSSPPWRPLRIGAIRANRFAENPYFQNVRLKPATRNVLVPRNAIRRKRGSVREPCSHDSRESSDSRESANRFARIGPFALRTTEQIADTNRKSSPGDGPRSSSRAMSLQKFLAK